MSSPPLSAAAAVPVGRGGVTVAAADWAACDAKMRQHGRAFFLASRSLPLERRRAIAALYAYCRIADDLVDRSPDAASAARALAAWERELSAPSHPVAVAFAAAVARYQIPTTPVADLLEGVRTDLDPQPFPTWDDLARYCYQVAGTVGLMAAPILGCRDAAALSCAVKLGMAMQLTNIVRDVAEDARGGRLYLPLADLAAFGCTPESVLAGRPDGAFSELVAFQIARARRLYAESRPGLPALCPSGRLAALAAGTFYAAILDRIEARDYAVFAGRAVVPSSARLRAVPRIAADYACLSVRSAGRGLR